MNNIPEKIYLNIGNDVPDDADFRDLEEVTWSEERINDNDIEYGANLQDFTTDELRAELKRRATEARKAANANRDRKAKYLYAEGTVTNVHNTSSGRRLPFADWSFKVHIDDEYATKHNIKSWDIERYLSVNRANIKKSNAPKEGDRVRLKCRVTKDSPRWNMFCQPIIDEVITEIGKEVEG